VSYIFGALISRIELQPRMLKYISIIVVVICSSIPARAQVRVGLYQDLLTRSDTLWVDVRLGEEDVLGSSSIDDIYAFSFAVETSDGLMFIGISDLYTLTDTDGWSSAFSAVNGKVGGFASRQSAIAKSGILIRLQFLITGTDTYEELELINFRLNGGDPDHIPAVPSLRIDLESHSE
jgi:hypothetical protein